MQKIAIAGGFALALYAGQAQAKAYAPAFLLPNGSATLLAPECWYLAPLRAKMSYYIAPGMIGRKPTRLARQVGEPAGMQ